MYIVLNIHTLDNLRDFFLLNKCLSNEKFRFPYATFGVSIIKLEYIEKEPGRST